MYQNQSQCSAMDRGLMDVRAVNKQSGELEQIDKQLSASLAVLHEVNGRVRALSDRLLGPQPEAVDATGGKPPYASAVSKLHEVSGYIASSLDDLRSLVARLERL